MKVSDFHYDLPEFAISQSAVEPRHDARLLDTRDMSDHRFFDLPGLLRPGDLVVVNDTRVRAARLKGHRRGTGGVIELLILAHRKDGTWEAMARPARRLRPGAVIDLDDAAGNVVEILGEGRLVIEFDVAEPETMMASKGQVPLPPYFTGSLAHPDRYQTVYANRPGSAAAPTAGLHFTAEVLSGLESSGIGFATVELHVSLDTFRPMKVEMVEDHIMHSEWCSVPELTARAVQDTRAGGGRIVAVGTTVVRTLESYADGDGRVAAGSGPTSLFLIPGTPITVADLLVTNFHLPDSTLLVLLEAFMGPTWKDAYRTALGRSYRFLSFGDSMLAERRR